MVGEPLKILVVDDDSSIRNLLDIAFSVEPGVAEVRSAANGLDAVAVCSGFSPDLVVLDYWMPTMDGETAAARIRELHPKVRIVAFSGTLDERPGWADELYVKGDLPDLELVLDVIRAH